MSRIIKFRAWDGSKMHQWQPRCEEGVRAIFADGNVLINHTEINGQQVELLSDQYYGLTLNQFTGLIDKKRTEIYEGDIVSWEKRLYEVVVNFNGYYLQSYKLWRGEFKPAFQYALSLITKPGKDRFGGEVEKAEVVGNIYENPELLKK